MCFVGNLFVDWYGLAEHWLCCFGDLISVWVSYWFVVVSIAAGWWVPGL